MSVEIRRATHADLAGVVEIHLESFGGFFLTSLGPKFLTRFYASQVADDRCISLVAILDDRVVGFAFGPLDPEGFFRRLFRSQAPGFIADSLGALLDNPRRVSAGLLRAVTFRGDPPAGPQSGALLSSIAVGRHMPGTGVAGRLIEKFCAESERRGAASVYLTTDRRGNDAANRFYLKHGFVIESVVVRENGRSMNRYVKMFAEPQRAPE